MTDVRRLQHKIGVHCNNGNEKTAAQYWRSLQQRVREDCTTILVFTATTDVRRMHHSIGVDCNNGLEKNAAQDWY